VTGETGAIDVVVPNAGHMVLGSAESFTPAQVAEIYDTNVVSTQRVNRAVLPQMRAPRRPARVGRLVQHVRRDLAVPRAVLRRQGGHGSPGQELRRGADEIRRRDVRRGPGPVHLGHEPLRPRHAPADETTAAAYEELCAGLLDQVGERLAALSPLDADADDGWETVSDVADRVRRGFYARVDLTDLLTVRT
jgi:short subunit dehydrogenase